MSDSVRSATFSIRGLLRSQKPAEFLHYHFELYNRCVKLDPARLHERLPIDQISTAGAKTEVQLRAALAVGLSEQLLHNLFHRVLGTAEIRSQNVQLGHLAIGWPTPIYELLFRVDTDRLQGLDQRLLWTLRSSEFRRARNTRSSCCGLTGSFGFPKRASGPAGADEATSRFSNSTLELRPVLGLPLGEAGVPDGRRGRSGIGQDPIPSPPRPSGLRRLCRRTCTRPFDVRSDRGPTPTKNPGRRIGEMRTPS